MIDCLIATLLFLVIISIPLSRFSYFNLLFTPTFSYTNRGTLMEISFFRSFLGYSLYLRSSDKAVCVCSNVFIRVFDQIHAATSHVRPAGYALSACTHFHTLLLRFFKLGSIVLLNFQCLVSVRKLADLIFMNFSSKFSFAHFFSNEAQNGSKRVSKFAQNGSRHVQIHSTL